MSGEIGVLDRVGLDAKASASTVDGNEQFKSLFIMREGKVKKT